MKKTILVLIAILLVATLALTACSKKGTTTTDEPTVAAAVNAIGEEEAKAVALEKAGIPETAAENLVITESEYEGQKAFVVSFEWSGFEYEITVSATSGSIVYYIFDGDEMALD